MATRYRIFGQQAPANNTFATLYTVPTGYSAVVSSITACNYATANGTFRIAVVPGNQSLRPNSYIAFDTGLPAQDTIALSLGVTLSANDSIQVFSFQGNVSFQAFGSELN